MWSSSQSGPSSGRSWEARTRGASQLADGGASPRSGDRGLSCGSTRVAEALRGAGGGGADVDGALRLADVGRRDGHVEDGVNDDDLTRSALERERGGVDELPHDR